MLRYDDHGRPIGLDWTVCNDGNPRPEVWKYWWMTPEKRKKLKHPDTLNPGVGRGGNMWMGAQMERQIIDVYELTTYGPIEIANLFGITPKTVYRVFNRCGVPLKSRRAS